MRINWDIKKFLVDGNDDDVEEEDEEQKEVKDCRW